MSGTGNVLQHNVNVNPGSVRGTPGPSPG